MKQCGQEGGQTALQKILRKELEAVPSLDRTLPGRTVILN
ncbi:hypothetical protein AB205_0004500 [Aquarana catesbeiana]|uniref:Uncharacterized protein n=1 Tax=Aquarana catesbeiana TaxID=8400 RepID=A0A2G9SKZ4_AQUCT|nr:hypothetical protein AB205_0004500 [Aquarana catesbeiana]